MNKTNAIETMKELKSKVEILAESLNHEQIAKKLNADKIGAPASRGIRVATGWDRVAQARFNKKIWTTARVGFLLQNGW